MTPEMLEAIAELIRSIVWPALVLILILTQRETIATLLSNIESLTLPGVEAKIRNNVEKETKAILEEKPKESTGLSERQLEAAERIQRLSDSADLAVIRRQMDDLAREYERVRASMSAGDTRTRRMEVITTKMRTLGLAAVPLLTEFAQSDSPGRRLAAIAILQVSPDPNYIDWLAKRLPFEKPFLGYHAAVALDAAARTLEGVEKEKLQQAIKEAKAHMGERTTSDRWKILDRAENSLRDSY